MYITDVSIASKRIGYSKDEKKALVFLDIQTLYVAKHRLLHFANVSTKIIQR
jgi:hypothetical protein